MKYTVRTKEGELTYDSFGAVERAWMQGLVEPEDEILEEGSTRWRKAGAIKVLASARRQGDQVWGGSQMGLIVLFVVLGSVALYGISSGRFYIALVGGLLLAVLTIQISIKAVRMNKPHR